MWYFKYEDPGNLRQLPAWRYECTQTKVDQVSVLGPHPFINRITEVSRLFWQNGVLAFRAFVFLKLTILVNDLGVVHGDQRELTFSTIDNKLRVPRIFPFEDVHP